MANAGLPGTAGFVGEWMVILAAVKVNFWIGLAAATSLILGAAYSLWMVKRVYFGAVANDNVRALTDAVAEAAELLARGEDESFQNKVHLRMEAAGFASPPRIGEARA